MYHSKPSITLPQLSFRSIMSHFLSSFAVSRTWRAQNTGKGYTFRGSNSSIFIFPSHLKGIQPFKERIWSFKSKFFPFLVDPILERPHCAGSKQEVTKIYFQL